MVADATLYEVFCGVVYHLPSVATHDILRVLPVVVVAAKVAVVPVVIIVVAASPFAVPVVMSETNCDMLP